MYPMVLHKFLNNIIQKLIGFIEALVCVENYIIKYTAFVQVPFPLQLVVLCLNVKWNCN